MKNERQSALLSPPLTPHYCISLQLRLHHVPARERGQSGENIRVPDRYDAEHLPVGSGMMHSPSLGCIIGSRGFPSSCTRVKAFQVQLMSSLRMVTCRFCFQGRSRNSVKNATNARLVTKVECQLLRQSSRLAASAPCAQLGLHKYP
jgi:hypothetical protein